MSEAERSDRLQPGHETTVDDIRALAGPATPHFALQIRNRIERLIAHLPEGHPARAEGMLQVRRLTELASNTGEPRGPGTGQPAVSGDPTAATGADRVRTLLDAESRERATLHEPGYLDLIGPGEDVASTGPAQDLMNTGVVPAIYERWWRPTLGRAVKGLTGPGMDEEVRIARLLLGLDGGRRVLDVACGPGNFSREFARAVGDQGTVAGFDASETMLAKAVRETTKAGLGNVGYVRGDVAALPFPDGCFDAVCCFAALHLFADPFDAITEMTRVLAPGGRIALVTSVRRQIAVPPLKPLVERASGMRVFEHEEIVSALRMRGYTDVHQRVSGLVQFVGGRLAP